MTSNARQTVLKLVVLGLSLGLAGLSGEVWLRLIGRDSARVWAPDRTVGWRPIPGAKRHWTDEGDSLIQINSRGFRDRERRLDPDPAVPRIAIFGDSMTEADQVNLDQTYASRLEAGLQREGHAAEVLNLGVTGYSPIQELQLFREEAPTYRPQVVVLALFLDNDVSGCHPQLSVAPEAPFATLDGGRLRFDYSRAEASYDNYFREPLYLLRRYSALYRTFSALRQRSGASATGRARDANTVPIRFEVYEKTPRRQWQEAWTTLEGVLDTFADDAHRLGAELVILSIPAAQVVDPRAWERLLEDHPAMRAQQWDLGGPERRLRAFAETRHLRLVQPYKEFENAVRSDTLYFGDVGHMTSKGHELVAAELDRFLTAERLIDGQPRRAQAQ